MLASCYGKLGDDAGLSRSRWTSSSPPIRPRSTGRKPFAASSASPGSPTGNALDVLRLRHATGTFGGADSYVAMTQRAMAAALPAEAKRISDEGFASGALGTGADADAQKSLRDAAAKQVIDDQKQLPAKRQGRRRRRAAASRSSTSASRT